MTATFYSDGQMQTKLTNDILEERNTNISALQDIDTSIHKLSKVTDDLYKEILMLHRNLAAQQTSLEILNRLTAENLQIIVDTVQQIVHISQNTQDNTQLTAEKLSKLHQFAEAHLLLQTDINRRNTGCIHIIQETTKQIDYDCVNCNGNI